MLGTTTLLLIDAQKDFHPGGSLAIPAANEDAERIGQLLRESLANENMHIDRVVATLDSHHKLHIAHPCFWNNASSGKHPDPFTVISAKDLENGVWKPRSDLNLQHYTVDPVVFTDMTNIVNDDGTFNMQKYCIEYARRLEEKGRFQICIWPEHCLIGSGGRALVDPVRQALDDWSDQTGGSVEWVPKGQHLLTEMYSALQAEVPVSKDTAFNQHLYDSLHKYCDRLLVCGQAMSHCVNYTVRDLVSKWPKEEIAKIYLLVDGASAVPGFEDAAESFVADMKELGVTITTTQELVKRT